MTNLVRIDSQGDIKKLESVAFANEVAGVIILGSPTHFGTMSENI